MDLKLSIHMSFKKEEWHKDITSQCGIHGIIYMYVTWSVQRNFHCVKHVAAVHNVKQQMEMGIQGRLTTDTSYKNPGSPCWHSQMYRSNW